MRTVACGVSLLLLAASSTFGGVVVVAETGQSRSTIYLEGNKVRMEGQGHDSSITLIFDSAAKVVTVLNPTDQTYTQVTEVDARASGAAIEARIVDEMGKLREALDKMGPEDRQRFLDKMPPEQRWWGERPPPQGGSPLSEPAPTKYERTGERATVAGFACEWYREMRRGALDGEGCYIPWGAPGGLSKHDVRPVQALVKFGLLMLPPGAFSPRRLIAAPGFLALRKSIGGEAMTLVSIERQRVSADKFTPPPGYTKSAKSPFEQDEPSPSGGIGRGREP